MTVNFELKDFTAVTYEGRHIDLHNNFSFTGYEYNVAARRLVLRWEKADGSWVDEHEFSKLIFTHENVTFLHISYDNEVNEYPEDDPCLDGISYFPSSDRATNDGLMEQPLPQEGDDIIYLFEPGHFIRVCCAELILSALD